MEKKDLFLFVISPSSYDDNGELMQFHRILMRTSAHTVIASLAGEAFESFAVKAEIICIDERLERGEAYLEKIISLESDRTVIFITCKTFELSRGIDIAKKIVSAGKVAIMGGPGVTLTDWKTYEYLISQGIVFNVGEGEETVGFIIKDFLENKLKKVYWQRNFVDISKSPLPVLSHLQEHRKCLNPLVGISTSEGCPFGCSFCCIPTLRGKNITPQRSRDPEAVVEWIMETHRRGLKIMLTDDNLRRSFHYHLLKELLIKGIEKQGSRPKIFVQVDSAQGLEREIPDLAKMGVEQVFLGWESLDPEVLKSISKSHNKPSEYMRVANNFRKYGIMVNSGVILGFPNQTQGVIFKETKRFREILDLPSLFCATPFPGSRDYEEAIKKDLLITDDPNFYDTRHVCRAWFEKADPMTVERAFNRAVFIANFPAINSTRYKDFYMAFRNLRTTAYGLFLGFLGYAVRGRPYHYMMDGIPRKSGILRPSDSFKGFRLTEEDLWKKRSYLEGL